MDEVNKMLDKTDREEITEIVKEVIETDVTPQFVSLKKEMSEMKKETSELMDARFAQHTKETSELMDARFAQHTREMSEMMDTKLVQQKEEIMQEVSVLMDSKFMPMFNLLAEGQQAIIDRLIPEPRIEKIERDVDILKITVKQLSEDVREIKQKQK